MNKTFQYRLYPTNKQQTLLNTWLALCCEVYNAALQERRDAYRMTGVSLSYAHQCAELPNCKEVRPELAEVNSQVLQDVHAGKKQEGRLILSKLGHSKMVMHRPLTGIRHPGHGETDADGQMGCRASPWKPSRTLVLCPHRKSRSALMSVSKRLPISRVGERIDNPRCFRKEGQALARAHRKLSQAHKGTLQREKRRQVVARVHERVRWRENFIRQEVASLIKRFGFIAVEALVVRNMLKNPKVAKSIAKRCLSRCGSRSALCVVWSSIETTTAVRIS
jgi:putative transposase